MTTARRPAGDLIDAIVHNMRENLEELRYSTLAPSRYTVYLSPAEHARLEGLIPRLRAESVRALDEEMARLNRRKRLRRLGGWLRQAPALENADLGWHIEFLPDLDGELTGEQDILVQSELVIPAAPELGAGERTRRVKTHAASNATTREEVAGIQAPITNQSKPRATASARLTYLDQDGSHRHDIARASTSIGRGGRMYPVDVRVVANDDVSREHARIRRDENTGAFFLIDLSSHGTTIDGQPVPRGYDEEGGTKRENGTEVPLPTRARIGLAGVVFLDFEALP
ncbi:MAG: FHA domain-containing protein [Acidobacteriota bacterium]